MSASDDQPTPSRRRSARSGSPCPKPLAPITPAPPPRRDAGKPGADAPAALEDPKQSLEALALYRRAVRANWNIKPKWKRIAAQRVHRLIRDTDNEEIRISAIRTLALIDAQEIKALREAYQDERTREGLENNRQGISVELGDETIAALARTLTDGNRDPG